MGKIKGDPAYDPFPKSGLVKQYEPFIRAWVSKFCVGFPWVHYDNALIAAVRLADQAANRFNPDLGHDFSTFLRRYLKKLYAMQEEEKGWSHAAPTNWAQDQERSPQPQFPSGANGTRVAFDRWKLHDDDKRGGVVIAMRLNSGSESSVGFSERVSAALTVLGDDDGPGKLGRLRAAIDHLERRHREDEAEAEDRRYGIYTPTLFEARRVPLHLERYEARTPRHSARFPDKYDGREEWEDGWQNQLGIILYLKSHNRPLTPRPICGEEIDAAEDQFFIVAAALRPRLSADERVVLDWMGDQMFSEGLGEDLEPRPRMTAERLADQIGRSKRTIYKIRDRLILKLKKELKK